mmetsp:Transcript_51921/g.137309  ORF Transcript_51921/g.137309 Transcript_51921/m.137309 type:complete len:265 (-) Transcript_51921:171-965(-)
MPVATAVHLSNRPPPTSNQLRHCHQYKHTLDHTDGKESSLPEDIPNLLHHLVHLRHPEHAEGPGQLHELGRAEHTHVQAIADNKLERQYSYQIHDKPPSAVLRSDTPPIHDHHTLRVISGIKIHEQVDAEEHCVEPIHTKPEPRNRRVIESKLIGHRHKHIPRHKQSDHIPHVPRRRVRMQNVGPGAAESLLTAAVKAVPEPSHRSPCSFVDSSSQRDLGLMKLGLLLFLRLRAVHHAKLQGSREAQQGLGAGILGGGGRGGAG